MPPTFEQWHDANLGRLMKENGVYDTASAKAAWQAQQERIDESEARYGRLLEDVTEDVCGILCALQLGDHARPYSPREVVYREVIPEVAKLVMVFRVARTIRS